MSMGEFGRGLFWNGRWSYRFKLFMIKVVDDEDVYGGVGKPE